MKNMQIIDGAENCSFSICSVDDNDFAIIFPQLGQDIEFIEDLFERIGNERAAALVQRATTQRIQKKKAMGIDGTLFFGMPQRRKYFPNKRDDDIKKPDFYLPEC
jgi:hypothetical protein